MRDGNSHFFYRNTKFYFSSFRSDYEGWKLVMILKCSLSILIVLEVTMRDGNTSNSSATFFGLNLTF